MLSEDDPEFHNWDQDATAVEMDYFHQDPIEVGTVLTSEIEATATAFDRVDPNAWARTGRRSNGSLFSVETFVIYVVHDLEHHLVDIQRGASEGQ
jgi:protein tyrosine phosphatase (PTP) superfamily phosphohydrolase (DUF442 family)